MKYLVLVLFLAGCERHPQPKYHIGDAFRITHGFYLNCTGEVIGFDRQYRYYSVHSLQCPNGISMSFKILDQEEVE